MGETGKGEGTAGQCFCHAGWRERGSRQPPSGVEGPSPSRSPRCPGPEAEDVAKALPPLNAGKIAGEMSQPLWRGGSQHTPKAFLTSRMRSL